MSAALQSFFKTTRALLRDPSAFAALFAAINAELSVVYCVICAAVNEKFAGETLPTAWKLVDHSASLVSVIGTDIVHLLFWREFFTAASERIRSSANRNTPYIGVEMRRLKVERREKWGGRVA